MKRILVVDGDAATRELLVDYFSQHAFRIDAVESLSQMQQSLAERPADLVILDINKHLRDGFAFLGSVSEIVNTPVIVMSGDRLSEDDRVAALEQGAADYVAKPLGLRELLARVRAHIRDKSDARCGSQYYIYTFDDWRLSTRHRRLRDGNGEEVKLTAGELNLLIAFLQAPRQILSREQLLLATRIHDQEVFDRSVDVLILRLRRKLEEDASRPKYIKTERRAGYIFDAEVHSEQMRIRVA